MKRITKFVFGTLQTSLNWLARPMVLVFIAIFILAFRIRINQLDQIPSEYLAPNPGWELNAIAISLYKGEGFANPYKIATGPTAHLPPIYPYLISLIYRIYGVTTKAGVISFQFLALTNALLCALLPWLAHKLGLSMQAGIIGGLAGTFIVEWYGHGEFLAAVMLGLVLVAFLGRWCEQKYSWGGSLLLGIAIGVSFHIQPALLSVILGCLTFELWWSRSPKKWAHAGVLVLGILLACIPWGWRNYKTFGTIFFIRSNLGLEMRVGYHEGAVADIEMMDHYGKHFHPAAHFAEAKKMREIGEIAYMQGAMEDALTWITANPAKSLRLVAQRVVHIWFGPPYDLKTSAWTSALTVLVFLGVWCIFPALKIPQRAVLLIPLAAYPLIYYIVGYLPRYRAPIDWILFILAGVEVWHWVKPKAPENTHLIKAIR